MTGAQIVVAIVVGGGLALSIALLAWAVISDPPEIDRWL